MRAADENFGNLGYEMTIFPADLRRVTFNGGLACDLFPKESSLYTNRVTFEALNAVKT